MADSPDAEPPPGGPSKPANRASTKRTAKSGGSKTASKSAKSVPKVAKPSTKRSKVAKLSEEIVVAESDNNSEPEASEVEDPEGGAESPNPKRRTSKTKEDSRPYSDDMFFEMIQSSETVRFNEKEKTTIRFTYMKDYQITGVWLCINGLGSGRGSNQINQAELAGYLHLSDTLDLLYFIKTIESSILKPYKDSKEAGFGSSDPAMATKKYTKRGLLDALNGNGFSAQARAAILGDKFPLLAQDVGLKDTDPKFAYANMFWAMNKIIDRHPNSFPNTSPDDFVVWHRTQENWSRADEVLSYYIRSNTATRKKSGKRTPPSKPAFTPVFARPSDDRLAQDPVTGEHGSGAELNQMALERLRGEVTRQVHTSATPKKNQAAAEDSEVDEAAAAKAANSFLESVASNPKSAKNGQLHIDRGDRPPLTLVQRREASRLLGRLHRVIWDGADENKFCDQESLRMLAEVSNMAEACVKDHGSELTEEELTQFWETQRQLSVISAQTKGYLAACLFLKLDPKNPVLPHTNLQLKVWQVMDIAWMIEQEETLIGGGIIASDCGSGKTFTLLAAIYLKYLRLKEAADAGTPRGPYKCTVIMAPSAVVNQWVDQVEKHMEGTLNVFQFYGTSKSVSSSRRSILIGSDVHALNAELAKMDTTNVETAKTVIFTSYTTWSDRCLRKVILYSDGEEKDADDDDHDEDDADGDPEDASLELSNKPPNELDAYENEFDDHESTEYKDENGRSYKIIYKSRILHVEKVGRVGGDEAHVIKNPRTRSAEAVRQLYPNHKWHLTATPMLNRISDLRGYLWQLWNPKWVGLIFDSCTPATEMFKDLFDPENVPVYALDTAGNRTVVRYYSSLPERTAENAQFLDTILHQDPARRIPLYMLDPVKFREISINTDWDTETAALCLPKLLPLIQVRRTMESFVDREDGTPRFRVGQDIPPFRIRTVIMGFSEHLRKAYSQIASILAPKLQSMALDIPPVPTTGNTATDNFVNADAIRQMHHACFDLDLSVLTTDVKKDQKQRKAQGEPAVGSAEEVARWRKLDLDCGVTYKWNRVRKDPTYPAYTDRISMAETIVAKSPKMAYVLQLLADWCLDKKEKVLVMLQYPMPQWDLEGLLALLGYTVLTIRAQHSPEERRSIVNKFNDPNYKCDVLLVGMKLGAYGLDFHHDCCKLIICELPQNVGTLVQAIGRVHRVGQAKQQEVVIITVENTYDTYEQDAMADKFIPQIAGEGDLGETKDRAEAAAEVLRKMLGQRPPKPKDGNVSTPQKPQKNKGNEGFDKKLASHQKRKAKEQGRSKRDAKKARTAEMSAEYDRLEDRWFNPTINMPNLSEDDQEDESMNDAHPSSTEALDSSRQGLATSDVDVPRLPDRIATLGSVASSSSPAEDAEKLQEKKRQEKMRELLAKEALEKSARTENVPVEASHQANSSANTSANTNDSAVAKGGGFTAINAPLAMGSNRLQDEKVPHMSGSEDTFSPIPGKKSTTTSVLPPANGSLSTPQPYPMYGDKHLPSSRPTVGGKGLVEETSWRYTDSPKADSIMQLRAVATALGVKCAKNSKKQVLLNTINDKLNTMTTAQVTAISNYEDWFVDESVVEDSEKNAEENVNGDGQYDSDGE